MGNSHKNLLLRNHWAQIRRFLWEFPIGSYVKLIAAVVAILVGGLNCQTQFWKGTTQGPFQQSMVEIGSVVSEEKIFLPSKDHSTKLWWNDPWMVLFQKCVRCSRLPTKMATRLKIEKRGMKFKKNLLL
jgi:hypothetical protein